MKRGGERLKGGAFERETAKAIIATFVDRGITDLDCYRTPLSGGHRFASKTDPGDLVCSSRLMRLWPFSVECKFYAKIELHWLMVPDVKKGLFSSWWGQACAAAGNCREPLLVFKANRQQPYVMFRAGSGHVKLRSPYITAKVNGESVIVMRRSALLRQFNKAVI